VSTIGRYEIRKEVGRGAMGVVYLADDPRLRRSVAVKTFALPGGLSEDQKHEFRERFLREAQAAGGLCHPGIVTIYDADEDPDRGVPFIAMEYVPGKSLAEVLSEKGRLDPERVFAIAGVLADALHLAHNAGIVHRDLKPANLLVCETDGAVKIADFGVARLPTSSLTRSGTAVGSPAYMSPEQIRGRPVDRRSDLFSLGTVLYECLCGQSPFSGEDLPQLAYSIVHETPIPISKRVPGLSAALDAFFDRALAKDPEGRFANGAEFRQALDRARRADPGQATSVAAAAQTSTAATRGSPAASDEAPPPGGPSAAPPIGARAVAVAVLTVLAVIAWWYWNASGGAYLQIRGESSVEGSLTVTVDGKRAYSRDLEAPSNKAVGFMKRVVGKGEESFDAWIEVAPGRHEVVAYVVTDDKPTGHQDRVTVDLERGETRTLRLSAGRSFGAPVALRVD
jgi:serine/threonine-protein kinase